MEKIKITQLKENPNNPRKDLGDLEELTESIKAKGILQNLTVVTDGKDYTIVIGHRRAAAAKKAGLKELPCNVVEMSEKEQLEVMLLENIQRNELTPYEQAQGFQLMIDLGGTAKAIAESTGFSVKTVRRRLKLAELPAEKVKEAGHQLTLTQLLDLDKLKDIDVREKVIDDVLAGRGSYEVNIEMALKKQEAEERRAGCLELVEKAGVIERKANSWDRDVAVFCWLHYERDIDADSVGKILKEPDQLFYYEGYSSMMIYKLQEVKEEAREETPEEKLERAKKKQIDETGKRIKAKIEAFADAVTPEQAERERKNVEELLLENLENGGELTLDMEEGDERSVPWLVVRQMAKDLADDVRWIYNWQGFQEDRAKKTNKAYVLLEVLGYEQDEEELNYLTDRLPEPVIE